MRGKLPILISIYDAIPRPPPLLWGLGVERTEPTEIGRGKRGCRAADLGGKRRSEDAIAWESLLFIKKREMSRWSLNSRRIDL